jgi:hypothetical protein
MAKKSFKAQFDEIQARLEAAGMTTKRESNYAVKASVSLHKSGRSHEEWVGSIDIARNPIRKQTDARIAINYVSQWESGEMPADVFAALLAKPFGHTTINVVFGL